MAYDPNNPQADPNNPLGAPVETRRRGQARETDATQGPPWIDPRDGRRIGERDTLTFTEWCLIDPSLAAADEAAYDQYYRAQADAQRAQEKEVVEAIPGSAFAMYYGPAAEQKMDRSTLDLRIEGMSSKLEMNPVAQIPGAPVHPPGTPEGDDPQPVTLPVTETEAEAQARREREAAPPPA